MTGLPLGFFAGGGLGMMLVVRVETSLPHLPTYPLYCDGCPYDGGG